MAFLGDDTVPSKGWLASHAKAHADRPEEEMLAVEDSFQRDMDRFEMLLDMVELRREYSRTQVPD